MQSKLGIKNMVCPRCISAVRNELENLDIEYLSVGLGEIILKEELNETKANTLKYALEKIGFELLEDRKTKIVEKIKNFIIEMVHHQEDPERMGHLIEQLPGIIGSSYSSISKLFSETEGLSIERFLILQKIEKAKEFLIYDELSIKEIAFSLNYSNSQHFSNQFKSITGMSPIAFKKNRNPGRKPIDQV